MPVSVCASFSKRTSPGIWEAERWNLLSYYTNEHRLKERSIRRRTKAVSSYDVIPDMKDLNKQTIRVKYDIELLQIWHPVCQIKGIWHVHCTIYKKCLLIWSGKTRSEIIVTLVIFWHHFTCTSLDGVGENRNQLIGGLTLWTSIIFVYNCWWWTISRWRM